MSESEQLRNSPLKQRIRRGDLLIGGWLTVRSIEIAEALASTGVDWIAADLEHGTLDVGSASDAFIAMERHGTAPVARLSKLDAIQARRLLDVGVEALLVPVVEDADSFAEFAEACLYSPTGHRGNALGRFNAWGDTFDDYRKNFVPALIPMIETRKGIASASSIASLDCVDALFFGPYDLSADLGDPGNFTSQEFVDAKAEILNAASAAGISAGGHQVAIDSSDLLAMIEEGFRFIAYGTDVVALRTSMGSLPRDGRN